MIFQTETQLKDGDKLADDHKVGRICINWIENGTPISRSSAIQTALDNINAAWKTATEAMYSRRTVKLWATSCEGDNVQDVDMKK
jgi:molecular chaperone DnaK